MTDRELCEGIIKNGGCLYLDGMDCRPSEEIRGCPFYNKSIPCDNKKSIVFATQWLKDHSKYTYADVDLPEWWDGRPIKGYAWTAYKDEKELCFCHALYIRDGKPVYTCNPVNNKYFHDHAHFEPTTEPKKTVKVTITENGETREVTLTDEQVKELGL